MMILKRINEVYTEWKSGKGFFHFLYYYFAHASPVISCEFLPDAGTAELLDMKYHAGFSGNKITSPFVDSFLDDFDGMQDAYFTRFAEIFWKINSENLNRQWEIQKSEYNPLNNYDMTETGHNTHTGMNMYNGANHSETGNTGTDTTRQNTDMTTETGANDSSITTHTINGFNSSAGVPADSTQTTDKTQTTGTANNNYTEVEHGLTTTTDGNSNSVATDTDTDNHELTRSGNIGVTTSTQMLTQHAEMWDKWNFYETVLFPAVDRLLTIPMY